MGRPADGASVRGASAGASVVGVPRSMSSAARTSGLSRLRQSSSTSVKDSGSKLGHSGVEVEKSTSNDSGVNGVTVGSAGGQVGAVSGSRSAVGSAGAAGAGATGVVVASYIGGITGGTTGGGGSTGGATGGGGITGGATGGRLTGGTGMVGAGVVGAGPAAGAASTGSAEVQVGISGAEVSRPEEPARLSQL